MDNLRSLLVTERWNIVKISMVGNRPTINDEVLLTHKLIEICAFYYEESEKVEKVQHTRQSGFTQ